MRIIVANNVTDAYHYLICDLMTVANYIKDTREIQNCIVRIKQPSLKNMSFYLRKLSLDYANAELEWYWTGDNSCKTIGEHAKKWLSITDDGETSNSAYGYILFKKYGKNQLEEVIELLKQDPSTRRAVLNISDPTIDRLETKDMQCTVSLQFFIRNGKLDTTVCMRSNDVYYGFPYDYIFFVSIAQYIAQRLNVDLGEYIHHAASMHIYESSYKRLTPHDDNISIDVRKYYKMYEQLKENNR